MPRYFLIKQFLLIGPNSTRSSDLHIKSQKILGQDNEVQDQLVICSIFAQFQGWIHPKTVYINAQRAVALPFRLFSAENTRSLRMLGSKVSLLAFLDISFSLRVELETFRPSVFSPWCWILQDLQPFESFISGQHSMVMLEADSIPLIRIMRSNEVIFRRLIHVQHLKYRGFKNYM